MHFLDVPFGWTSVPMWSIVTRKDRKGYSDAELLSVYREYGVIRKSDRDDNHNVESEDLSNYKFVKKGDLVLNKMKTWQGSLGVSSFEGIVSPAYYVCELNEELHAPFIHYLLRSAPYIAMYGARSKGIRVGQWDLPYEEFREIPVLLPPIEEQRRIADYLEDKLNAIDGIQQKRSQQILALKEASQSLTLEWVPNSINNVFVEKFESNAGLNIRAKYLFQELKASNVDAPLASATMDGVVLREEMDTDVWNPQDSTQSYKLVEPGDFVINLRSFQHGFSYSEVRGKVSPAYTVFRLRHELLSRYSSRYFSYLFQSRQFIGQLESISVGIRQGRNIPYEDFANLLIPIPNKDLQNDIEEQQLRNSARVALLMKSAGPLTELRQSLITSVVTGNLPQNI